MQNPSATFISSLLLFHHHHNHNQLQQQQQKQQTSSGVACFARLRRLMGGLWTLLLWQARKQEKKKKKKTKNETFTDRWSESHTCSGPLYRIEGPPQPTVWQLDTVLLLYYYYTKNMKKWRGKYWDQSDQIGQSSRPEDRIWFTKNSKEEIGDRGWLKILVISRKVAS